MICDICGGGLPPELHAAVNGVNCHAVGGCFAKALRRMKVQVAELEIALDSAMKPITAYEAGFTYVSTVGKPRKPRKPKK